METRGRDGLGERTVYLLALLLILLYFLSFLSVKTSQPPSAPHVTFSLCRAQVKPNS